MKILYKSISNVQKQNKNCIQLHTICSKFHQIPSYLAPLIPILPVSLSPCNSESFWPFSHKYITHNLTLTLILFIDHFYYINVLIQYTLQSISTCLERAISSNCQFPACSSQINVFFSNSSKRQFTGPVVQKYDLIEK